MLKQLKDGLRPYWHRIQGKGPRIIGVSETSKCRGRLAPFCIGSGLDLGFGGDPINRDAIRVDLPNQYGAVGLQAAQLRGDAGDLRWFRDGTLDYIFSSHLLEDFQDTEAVLLEWWRVLRQGGRLIIFCPDEQIYRAHCERTGQGYNVHHVHADFSLKKIRMHLDRIGPYRVLHELPLVDDYSWDLVAEKV
jgi:SAM-dependent methyltransferase